MDAEQKQKETEAKAAQTLPEKKPAIKPIAKVPTPKVAIKPPTPTPSPAAKEPAPVTPQPKVEPITPKPMAIIPEPKLEKPPEPAVSKPDVAKTPEVVPKPITPISIPVTAKLAIRPMAKAPTPTLSPAAREPAPVPKAIPKAIPKAKPIQPEPIPDAPQPKTVIPTPPPQAGATPVTKTAAGDKKEGFQEIKLKPLEKSAHVKLAPQINTDLPPAATPVAPEKPQPDAVGAPPALSGPVVSRVEPVEGPAAPVSSAAESKPTEPAPPLPRVAPEEKPAPEPRTPPPEPAKPLIPAAAGVFKFYCPTCQQKLSAKIDWQGKTILCPSCETAIAIPTL